MKELGLEVHDQYSTGAKFARLSDGNVRKYTSSLPKISPFSLLDIYFFVNKVKFYSHDQCFNGCRFLVLSDCTICNMTELKFYIKVNRHK